MDSHLEDCQSLQTKGNSTVTFPTTPHNVEDLNTEQIAALGTFTHDASTDSADTMPSYTTNPLRRIEFGRRSWYTEGI